MCETRSSPDPRLTSASNYATYAIPATQSGLQFISGDCSKLPRFMEAADLDAVLRIEQVCRFKREAES
jgi:hypothetical protein